MNGFTHKIAVIIPSTTNINETAPAETINQWIKSAKVRFAELFGGFTSHKAVGGWMSPIHGLVEESVTIVASFTDEVGLTHLGEVKAFASRLAEALSQEAVAVEVDHSLQFVTPLSVAA
jgi:hypothetical protein